MITGGPSSVTASRLGVVANIVGYEGVLIADKTVDATNTDFTSAPQGHLHLVDAMLTVFDLSGGCLCAHVGVLPRPCPQKRPSALACVKQHLPCTC